VAIVLVNKVFMALEKIVNYVIKLGYVLT
jgi:hypothetical protein